MGGTSTLAGNERLLRGHSLQLAEQTLDQLKKLLTNARWIAGSMAHLIAESLYQDRVLAARVREEAVRA